MDGAGSSVLETDSENGSRVLRKIQHFCEEDYLCDITLVAGDYSVRAHKVILAANSDYFYALFSKNWKENLENNVSLHDLTQVGLRAVIEFVYRGRLSLNSENIREVLSAVHHCQLTNAVNLCEMHLIRNIDQDNFLALLTLTNLYNLQRLQGDLAKFAAQEFIPSYTEAETHLLNEVSLGFMQMVIEYCPLVRNGCGVIASYDAARLWARTNQQMDHWKDLVAPLRREGYDIDELKFGVMSLEERRKDMEEDFQTCYVTSCLFLRKGDEKFVFDFIAYNEARNSWERLPLFQNQEMKSTSDRGVVIVMDGILYFCSGILENSKNAGACYKYDPCVDKWVKFQSLSTPRHSFSLVGYDGKLYILGGKVPVGNPEDFIGDENEIQVTSTASVQICDVSADQWSEGVPLPSALSDGAACVLEGKIFYSGGDALGLSTDHLYCFDPMLQSWSQKADMISKRTFHEMVPLGQCLYVIGGSCEGVDADKVPADIYDVCTNTWSRVTGTHGLESEMISGCCSFNEAIHTFVTFNKQEQFQDDNSAEGTVEIERVETFAVGKLFPENFIYTTLSHNMSMTDIKFDAKHLVPMRVPCSVYDSFATFSTESMIVDTIL